MGKITPMWFLGINELRYMKLLAEFLTIATVSKHEGILQSVISTFAVCM